MERDLAALTLTDLAYLSELLGRTVDEHFERAADGGHPAFNSLFSKESVEYQRKWFDKRGRRYAEIHEKIVAEIKKRRAEGD